MIDLKHVNDMLSPSGLKLIENDRAQHLCGPLKVSGRDNAAQALVELAWGNDPAASLALEFLQVKSPETYVRAIYAAHGTDLTA